MFESVPWFPRYGDIQRGGSTISVHDFPEIPRRASQICEKKPRVFFGVLDLQIVEDPNSKSKVIKTEPREDDEAGTRRGVEQ